ncbi:MAG: hypothetical protein GC179_19205 [Anaerolineaceae bacterium]|nr:hypothetical protein [Anaerolineaceae bacterium]
MTTIVFFIEQIAVGLYILIGLGIFWMLRRWAQAGYNLRSTQFEYERDMYRYKRANAITSLILLVQAALIVVGIQTVVAPTIRANAVDSADNTVAIEPKFETPVAPDVNFAQSPIDSSGVVLSDDPNANKIQSTDVPTPTPVGTILPNPPAAQGCDSPQAQLQIPGNGQLVFNPTRIIGTAFTDNFSAYRFELNGPSTKGEFAVLGEYTVPVTETGDLGQFVPSFYDPGAYQFRLTVFDITNALKAACMVNITISLPVPTATPIAPQ